MSVLARILSGAKQERVTAAAVLRGPARKFTGDRRRFLAQVRQAYAIGVITCYAQGFAQMQAASKAYGYNLKLDEIARIWQGGCIIRAKLLAPIRAAFMAEPELKNLMLAPYFRKLINKTTNGLRQVVKVATHLGTPCLGFSGALGYIDSYRQARLPANLLQAQRDYFGAHTYRRLDKDGVFHTEWDK
jgi:6-phosphogluconate dehydrogenase